MHPDLLNNSVFLRYYRQWQDDPQSIVFVSIVEYFLVYGMIDEALKVCREGLKKHPSLVTGRLAMAKIHMKFGNWEEAEEEILFALSIAPMNVSAKGLLDEVRGSRESEESKKIEAGSVVLPPVSVEMPHSVGPSWNTVTMARIYESQGHFAEAKAVYENILAADPNNKGAFLGLSLLSTIASENMDVENKEPGV